MKSARVREFIERKPSLEERPDYRSARLLIEAEDERAKQYYRSMLPSVDVSYSRGEFESFGRWQPGWTAMITLSVPLFNRLEDYSIYKTQAEKRREAELRIEQLRRDELNLQKAYQENFRLALQTAEAREKTLGTAQRLLKVNVARFKAGRADANDLAIERTRESQAEILAIEGWARAHASLVKLLHSYGQSIRKL
jgi:outer membrane protein TolC